MILAIPIITLKTSVKTQFGQLTTTKEVWDLLARLYSTANMAHQYRLFSELSHLKQKDG